MKQYLCCATSSFAVLTVLFAAQDIATTEGQDADSSASKLVWALNALIDSTKSISFPCKQQVDCISVCPCWHKLAYSSPHVCHQDTQYLMNVLTRNQCFRVASVFNLAL